MSFQICLKEGQWIFAVQWKHRMIQELLQGWSLLIGILDTICMSIVSTIPSLNAPKLINIHRYLYCFQIITYLRFITFEPMALLSTVWYGLKFWAVRRSDSYDSRASCVGHSLSTIHPENWFSICISLEMTSSVIIFREQCSSKFRLISIFRTEKHWLPSKEEKISNAFKTWNERSAFINCRNIRPEIVDTINTQV